MRGRWFKSRVVRGLAVVVTGCAALMLYAVIATRMARQKAEAFCQAIPVGTSAEVAAKAVDAAETERLLRGTSDGDLFVGFRGLFLDRYFCNLETAEGRVVRKEIRLLD